MSLLKCTGDESSWEVMDSVWTVIFFQPSPAPRCNGERVAGQRHWWVSGRLSGRLQISGEAHTHTHTHTLSHTHTHVCLTSPACLVASPPVPDNRSRLSAANTPRCLHPRELGLFKRPLFFVYYTALLHKWKLAMCNRILTNNDGAALRVMLHQHSLLQ